ncbi:hypothetical protein NCS52_00993400 [Fusarium sp. LHS14.1]|nr:hypothetical protein NCS52_00993400 [Fusarium sp. LHS14.1]
MAAIKNTFVSSATYNALPTILEVSHVPENHQKDLEDLRVLLAKHGVPSGVSIRLIHKHYDAEEGEVMAFKRLTIPSHGQVRVMRPESAPDASKLKGLHYFVDDDGSLQAYEYTTPDGVVDLSGYQPFVREFCGLVMERGLHQKFGLKLGSSKDDISSTEFEFPAERSTVMIPEGLPVPEGAFDVNITTEWGADAENKGAPGCSHTCSHVNTSCSHGNKQDSGCGAEMVLGGQIVKPETPVWRFMNAVIEVW